MKRSARVVLTDTNVFINLANAKLLNEIRGLSELSFVLPEQVYHEIRFPEHRDAVDSALGAGLLELIRVEVPALARYAGLLGPIGAGEAACLAVATDIPDSFVASDERRIFFRTAVPLIGEQRILTTPAIILRMIKAGVIDITRADEAKGELERHKFRMRFETFREKLDSNS